MKELKTLVCLGLWAILGFGVASAEDSYEYSVTVIPFAQDFVEETIESTPFTEEETDGTDIGLITVETPKTPPQTKSSPEQKEQPAPKVEPSPEATPYQKAIIDALIFGNTVRDFLQDGTSAREQLIKKYPTLTEISVTQLDSDYAKNQIKADKNYKDKWLLIAGSAGTIRDNKSPDIGPTMVLNELQKTAPYVVTQYSDHNKAREILGNLENGQLTSLICQVDEYEGPDVKLKNCEFFHDLLLDFAAPQRAQMLEAVEGRGNKAANASTAFVILALEKVLGEDFEKQCEQGPEACLIGFNSLESKTDQAEKYFPEILKEMHDLGYTDEMLGDGSEVETQMEKLFQ